MVLQEGKAVANASMVGGETEALHKLKKFAAECEAQPPKGGSHDSIYGANFSCKISPWLTIGCISPRSMFDEIKKTAARCAFNLLLFPFLSQTTLLLLEKYVLTIEINLIDRTISAAANRNDGASSADTGMNWLMFELLWRDFFR